MLINFVQDLIKTNKFSHKDHASPNFSNGLSTEMKRIFACCLLMSIKLVSSQMMINSIVSDIYIGTNPDPCIASVSEIITLANSGSNFIRYLPDDISPSQVNIKNLQATDLWTNESLIIKTIRNDIIRESLFNISLNSNHTFIRLNYDINIITSDGEYNYATFSFSTYFSSINYTKIIFHLPMNYSNLQTFPRNQIVERQLTIIQKNFLLPLENYQPYISYTQTANCQLSSNTVNRTKISLYLSIAFICTAASCCACFCLFLSWRLCTSHKKSKAAAAVPVSVVPSHDPDDDIWAVSSPKFTMTPDGRPTIHEIKFTPPTPVRQPNFATYNDML